MKSIMISKRDPNAEVKEDFADTLGHSKTNPIYYQDIETEKEYSFLVGGIAWSTEIGQESVAVIIGVTRGETPTFEVLDAGFNKAPRALLNSCFEMRNKYGFQDCSKILTYWYGKDAYSVALSELNSATKRPLILIPAPDWDKSNRDHIYVEQAQRIIGEGRLVIKPEQIKNSIRGLQTNDGSNLASFPAAAAVFYTLHSLIVETPWLQKGGAFYLDDENDNSEAFNLA